ncbi:GNAT family N-acetyltransferase [Hyphococcus luteus]|uniref:30S ribosomal protein S5 alanine N-acetyltransferase n=1 Tax=Hyphococcus luteus TaxID=2058213 RepID=A0A2S7K4V1_9PROT|nr:GNAT family protein [Marinicaulis flavus]PQA87537.1 30S ribosomal protein S5 alanine N-acetyltransferase [Marinicaulis flavus]
MLFANAPSNPAFNPVLVQEPVMLRAAVLTDYPAWAALRDESRAHLTEWEEAWTPEQASLSAFKRRLRLYDRDRRRGGGLYLLAFRIGDHALIGGATLSNIRYGASRSALLGYWVGAPYAQRGYGTAAVKAIAAHAFDAIELNRLTAACQPGNIASQKLLERCGFLREGLARDYLMINGAWRDHVIYALTAADCRKNKDAES